MATERRTADGTPPRRASHGRAPRGRTPTGRAPSAAKPHGGNPHGQHPHGRTPHGRTLGLRGRLALFFVAIVMLPLLVALLTWSAEIRRERQVRTVRTVEQAAESTARVLSDTLQALDVIVESLSTSETGTALVSGQPGSLDDDLEQVLGLASGVVDFLVAVDDEGAVVAEAGREPAIAPGQQFAAIDDIAAAATRQEGVPGAVVTGRELVGPDGRSLGFLAAGHWVDRQGLARLPAPARGGVATVAGDEIWASSQPTMTIDPTSLREEGSRTTAVSETGDALVAQHVAGIDVGGPTVVVWAPDAAGIATARLFLSVLLPAAVVAALAGWFLAGTVVAPIGRAAAAARAVAHGRLDERLPSRGSARELNELADSFNAMSRQLQLRLAELERSRDELRGSLSRLGETLSSSLDLDRTLAVVTETAMDTLAADRALLMLFTPERDALYAKVGRGVGAGVPRLRPGQGRLGWVASAGRAALVRAAGGDRDPALPPPVPDEPASHRQVVVPLVGRGETLGVLTLLRDDDGLEDFAEEDLETLQSFAAQAAVAVENVMLHEEAQRRSLTDPLTGLWNFRHFGAQAARELESAARFSRPLSLLVLDVDHFKTINDAYGHQAGDEALRELGRRIRESARAPDLVARYGGEEFVVLLPGTDAEGARTSAERIRRRVSEATYAVGPEPSGVDVTCSIGVAAYPQHGEDVPGLLRRADEALYAAKRAGRDRVMVWGETSSAPSPS